MKSMTYKHLSLFSSIVSFSLLTKFRNYSKSSLSLFNVDFSYWIWRFVLLNKFYFLCPIWVEDLTAAVALSDPVITDSCCSLIFKLLAFLLLPELLFLSIKHDSFSSSWLYNNSFRRDSIILYNFCPSRSDLLAAIFLDWERLFYILHFYALNY